MAFGSDKHQIDIWGYYCEDYCRECQKPENQRYCGTCESYYGEGQRHAGFECEQRLKDLLGKQLSFSFMKD